MNEKLKKKQKKNLNNFSIFQKEKNINRGNILHNNEHRIRIIYFFFL